MCSRDKEFTIRGTEDCLARGFDRTGFFEVDTGEQRAWTVQLTDATEQPSSAPCPACRGASPGGPFNDRPSNAAAAGAVAEPPRRL